MTPNNARKPVVIRITRAERERATDHLITAELMRRGYAMAVIDTATNVARLLLRHDNCSAFRAMRLAVGMAARLQLTLKPTLQPPIPGPLAV